MAEPAAAAPKRQCSKCGGDSQPGTILSPAYSAVGITLHANQALWYDGQPSMGIWGVKLPAISHPVTAHRCTRCGLVELYAG